MPGLVGVCLFGSLACPRAHCLSAGQKKAPRGGAKMTWLQRKTLEQQVYLSADFAARVGCRVNVYVDVSGS